MDERERFILLTTADQIATKMEAAIKLNGEGAEIIRELTNAFRNYAQADAVWALVMNRYNQLVEAQDKLLQANLQMQKEMIGLAARVMELERGRGDDIEKLRTERDAARAQAALASDSGE